VTEDTSEAGANSSNIEAKTSPDSNYSSKYPRDYTTKQTKNWSYDFDTEGQARQLAREKVGRYPVDVDEGKLRSDDGKWQYRAKPVDYMNNHVHIKELDPKTGWVKRNFHLYWPEGTER